MPDPDNDNDNPTPDFDDLIAQARQLREVGKNDEAIVKLRKALLEFDHFHPELCELMALHIGKGQPSLAIWCARLISFTLLIHRNSDLAEAGDACNRIFGIIGRISKDEVFESPGGVFALLSICAETLGEYDLNGLSAKSKAMAEACGWTDLHTHWLLTLLTTQDAEVETVLSKCRDEARGNPAAWFFVGELEIRQFGGGKESYWGEAREAWLQVPEDDPNYVVAMLQAGEYWELDAEGGEAEDVCTFRGFAEDCYKNAIEKVPRSKEVRRRILSNHLKLILAEASEYGFGKDHVELASELAGKMVRAQSGEPAETEQVTGTEGSREGRSPRSRLLAETDTIFGAQLLQGTERRLTDRISGSDQLIRDLLGRVSDLAGETQQVREEMRAGKEAFQNLQELLEGYISASAEAIHRYIVERLQGYQEQIANCEQKLSRDHGEFWERLAPESRRYLATGEYIRDKSPAGMECSGEAIEYTKAIETELRKHLIGRFATFAQENGHPSIFRRESGSVTLGSFLKALESPGLKSGFITHLGENGTFLSRDFHILKEIKKVRDAAAHGGDIGRQQATRLRDRILAILPKIVSLTIS